MPRRSDSNNPADWLFIAESVLEGVSVLAAQEISYTMCHSKVAEILEKVLKAELIRLGWPLVKTHDLVKLVDELQTRDEQFACRAQPLAEQLAEVYMTDRYPGFDLDDPDWPRLRGQLSEVSELLDEVKRRIGPPATGG